MQSIIETLGLTLIGAFTVQSVLTVLGAIQRSAAARQQHRLARDRLRLQIKAAELRVQEAESAKLLWNGYRKFQIGSKRRECDGVWSFRLEPHDRKALPAFKPGQYLTFQLNCPGRDKPVVRCYSLSDAPHADHYRVTIKREGPPTDRPDLPPGAASSSFCYMLRAGDILDAKAPSGHFNL